jgi:translation initiation factor IF-3
MNLFPIIKQVFSKTTKLDLVQVKPMSVPTGTLYYMDYNNEEFEKQKLLEERKKKIQKILDKKNG